MPEQTTAPDACSPSEAGTKVRRFGPPLALLAAMAGEEVRAETADLRPAPLIAASASPETALTYPSSFYARFAPQTAVDMLARTPGFVLDVGESVRGFAGGAGNVLVNGQRPSTKSDGLEDALRRIPASHVEKIEIIRSGMSGQVPGQSLVANVVRRPEAAGAGSAALTIEYGPQGRVFPNAEASYTRAVGAWQASATGRFELEYHPFHGRYRIVDAAGAPTEVREEDVEERYIEGVLTGALSGPFGGGLLALNGRHEQKDVRERQDQVVFAPAGAGAPSSTEDLVVFDRIANTEVGGDWTRALARDWQAKLVGLAIWGRADQDQEQEGRDAAGGVSAETFVLRQRSAEQIGRVTLSRIGEHRFLPEVGIELAHNRLDSRLRAAVLEDGVVTPITLPAANVRVTELRGEAFVNLKTQLTSRLSLETGLAGEWSRIAVSGDAQSRRNLVDLKPSAALLWKADARTQWRLAVARSVGQLDFADFAASVVASDDRPLGGNPNLRPDAATRLSLNYDRRYGRGGALTVEVFHAWREDVLEYILLADGGSALGNVAHATAWGGSVKVTQPLEPLVPGGQLRVEGELDQTRLRDPIDGRRRRINGTIPVSVTVGFRQDLARWRAAWGVDYTSRASEYLYFPGETLVDTNHPVWEAYVEKTLQSGFKVKLEGYALTDVVFDRERRFASPDSNRTPLGAEHRRRKRGGAYALLTISKPL
ncbi:outer membrane beta-barrel protein [Phenylobacterium sp. LjRoot225]|uniref:TonB-dependent receptor plug domain-containing protein n=1 Tax=Phenylobacterium sp. LjRoot225 TaxID=3342285 RepID=UPI003ED015A1